MSELDKAKRFTAHDDGPTPLALIAIAEQLTRIADMMQGDARRHEQVVQWHASLDEAAEDKHTPLTEEPPVGSTVTTEGGLVKRFPDGWQWLNAGPATWGEIRNQNPHLTTDAERKEAGIPLDDWLLSEPAEDDANSAHPYAVWAAHRAAKDAGLVAIKAAPGSSPSSYRRAADALEGNPSLYHLQCAAESYRAIAEGIEEQEEIG